VLVVDSDNTIVYVSDGCEQLLGWRADFKNKKAAQMSGFLLELVELAGVEPASAIPTSSVLHA